jgi:hypothetical protein
MNIVRLLTLSAASVGVAIAAGMMFQPDPDQTTAPELAAETTAPTEPAEAEATLAGGLAGSSSLTGMIGRAGRTAAAPGVDTEPAALDEPVAVLANMTEITPEDPSETAGLTEADMAELLAEASACAIWVVVTPEPAAMLDLSVYAPCDADAPVTISHGPMRLTGTVGPDGLLAMVMPALAPQAEVSVGFADGRSQSDITEVPDFGMFPRVIVQWDGAPVLDLHAYAGGARWGEPGHVTTGGPVSATSGFVSAMGGPGGEQVRVYTYPAGIAPESGLILLEAEVAITEASCGRVLDTTVHLLNDDMPISRREIRVDMPGCDAPGGFVLLPDLLPVSHSATSALN